MAVPFTTNLSSAEGVHVEPTAKRIRAVLDGQVVVDTTNALLAWEIPYYPQYYIPFDDVADGCLVPAGGERRQGPFGLASYFTVQGEHTSTPDGAWQYPEAEAEVLRAAVRFKWSAVDRWFEEDEEVFVHPRSPYVRVDVLDSSRTVKVEIDGVTVAESNRPKLLFETGLPTRYYLPKTDVRFDLLTPTDTQTSCPYKGTARYWTATVNGVEHADVVWGYDTPLAESIDIAGLVCFYDEKVDLAVEREAA